MEQEQQYDNAEKEIADIRLELEEVKARVVDENHELGIKNTTI